MTFRNRSALWVWAIGFMLIVGFSLFAGASLSKTAVTIYAIGALLGLNVFYFVANVSKGRIRWFVFALLATALTIQLFKLTDSLILPSLICLLVISAINLYIYIFNRTTNKA